MKDKILKLYDKDNKVAYLDRQINRFCCCARRIL